MNNQEEIIQFGMYRGKKWSELPLDYLHWLRYQGNRRANQEINNRLKAGGYTSHVQ